VVVSGEGGGDELRRAFAHFRGGDEEMRRNGKREERRCF
jgi:hypothetical protein